MIALTGDQKLIIAVIVLVMVVFIFVDWCIDRVKNPPLPRSSARLRKELERHYEEE